MRSSTSPQGPRQCRNQPRSHPTWSQPHVETEEASDQTSTYQFQAQSKAKRRMLYHIRGMKPSRVAHAGTESANQPEVLTRPDRFAIACAPDEFCSFPWDSCTVSRHIWAGLVVLCKGSITAIPCWKQLVVEERLAY
jgi:hypothetical protein